MGQIILIGMLCFSQSDSVLEHRQATLDSIMDNSKSSDGTKEYWRQREEDNLRYGRKPNGDWPWVDPWDRMV